MLRSSMEGLLIRSRENIEFPKSGKLGEFLACVSVDDAFVACLGMKVREQVSQDADTVRSTLIC